MRDKIGVCLDGSHARTASDSPLHSLSSTVCGLPPAARRDLATAGTEKVRRDAARAGSQGHMDVAAGNRTVNVLPVFGSVVT
jgi:hypothetical protein